VNKNESRLRRSKQTRIRISMLSAYRLVAHRTNNHIYAQLISTCGTKVLAAASTVEPAVRAQLKSGGNKDAAAVVGKLIAEKAIKVGVTEIAFDRSGFRYHGRIKALAEAAREAGLKF
jgi:large subunit ribosomal protein L18